MMETLYFEDFPVGRTEDFGGYRLDRDQIETYAAEFDGVLSGVGHNAPGALVLASPWQLCAILMRLNYDGWMSGTAARGAPGVDEIHWYRRVAADETLFARYTVRNARVSRSKPHLGIVQFYYELIDNDERPVLSQLSHVMMLVRNPQQPDNQPEEQAVERDKVGAISDFPPTGSRTRLGTVNFPADEIIAFARVYDPQPFHVDPVRAPEGPFGALAASGWHTAGAWARVYTQCLNTGRKNVPRPRNLLWLKPLHWRKPVFVNEQITFDFMPIKEEQLSDGSMLVTSLNRGLNHKGATVIEFTLGMEIDRPHSC